MIKRFYMLRKADLSTTHNALQVNPPDQPQFEGVMFSDGCVVLRWLTGVHSTSVWSSMDDMLAIHGHPEYLSELIWQDVEGL